MLHFFEADQRCITLICSYLYFNQISDNQFHIH